MVSERKDKSFGHSTVQILAFSVLILFVLPVVLPYKQLVPKKRKGQIKQLAKHRGILNYNYAFLSLTLPSSCPSTKALLKGLQKPNCKLLQLDICILCRILGRDETTLCMFWIPFHTTFVSKCRFFFFFVQGRISSCNYLGKYITVFYSSSRAFLMQCSLLLLFAARNSIFGVFSLADGVLFPDRIPESNIPGCAGDRGCKLNIKSRRAL